MSPLTSTLLNRGGLCKNAIYVLLDTIQISHAIEFTFNRVNPLPPGERRYFLRHKFQFGMTKANFSCLEFESLEFICYLVLEIWCF
jgi:hypothetical protein